MLKVLRSEWSNVLRTVCNLEQSNCGQNICSVRLTKKYHTSNGLREQSNYSHEYYFNMSSKHLAQGSSYPPVQEGKLRMLSMRFCPYAQRAVLVAIAKGIPHDVVNCNLKEKADWLLARNPNGKVPTLEVAPGKYLYESLVVSEYLDDTFKQRKLMSSDPFQRAVDKIWVEEFNKIISAFYKTLFAFRVGDIEAMSSNFDKFKGILNRFNEELTRRNSKFFGRTSSPGMLDYMIWPWIERIPAVNSVLSNESFNLEAELSSNTRLVTWVRDMENDPAIKEFWLPKEVHAKFFESFLAGSPNYDLLEEHENKSKL